MQNHCQTLIVVFIKQLLFFFICYLLKIFLENFVCQWIFLFSCSSKSWKVEALLVCKAFAVMRKTSGKPFWPQHKLKIKTCFETRLLTVTVLGCVSLKQGSAAVVDTFWKVPFKYVLKMQVSGKQVGWVH